jgi:hypothetical protein
MPRIAGDTRPWVFVARRDLMVRSVRRARLVGAVFDACASRLNRHFRASISEGFSEQGLRQLQRWSTINAVLSRGGAA